MSSWLRKLGWFILLWCLSIAALGIVAYGIRSVIYAG